MNKLYILLTTIVIAISFNVFAQNDYYTIHPGEKPVKVIPDSTQYFAKNFIKSQLWFNDGRTGAIMLNYNSLYGEMLFINEKGDTMAISSPQDFKQFALGKDTFYYKNDIYLHELGSFGNLKLAERIYFVLVDIKKIGAMGTVNSSVQIDDFKQIQAYSLGNVDLEVKQVISVKQIHQFYFGDENGSFKLALRKNLQKMAPNKSGAIKKYTQNNSVNFSNKDDIIKLLNAIQ